MFTAKQLFWSLKSHDYSFMIKNVIVWKLFSDPVRMIYFVLSQVNYFMNTHLITLKSISGFSIQTSLKSNTEENFFRLFRYLKLFSRTLINDASNYKNFTVFKNLFVSWKM